MQHHPRRHSPSEHPPIRRSSAAGTHAMAVAIRLTIPLARIRKRPALCRRSVFRSSAESRMTTRATQEMAGRIGPARRSTQRRPPAIFGQSNRECRPVSRSSRFFCHRAANPQKAERAFRMRTRHSSNEPSCLATVWGNRRTSRRQPTRSRISTAAALTIGAMPPTLSGSPRPSASMPSLHYRAADR